MSLLFQIICLLIIIFFITFVTWNIASRRHEIPCPSWLGWLIELDNPFTKYNRAAVIIDHARVVEGMRVIDFGCGPGRLTIPLAQKVGQAGKVIAVDIQLEMLERTKEKALAEGINNIEFIQTNIGVEQLAVQKSDLAFLVTVLGEIPNQQHALQLIFNCLKPGGKLIVTEVIFDPHFQRRQSVLKKAQKIGFRESDFYGNWAAYSLILEKP